MDITEKSKTSLSLTITMLALAVGLAGTAAVAQTRLTVLEKTVAEERAKREVAAERANNDNIRLSRIEDAVERMEGTVNEIRRDIKEMARENRPAVRPAVGNGR